MNLDMPWMWHAMIMLYDKFHNVTAPCLGDGEVGRKYCQNDTMGHCFRDYFRELRYPLTHVHSNSPAKGLDDVPGPIVFSHLDSKEPYETGMMLQGNWGPFQDDKHVDAAFSVHSKKGRDPYNRYMATTHKLCVENLGCRAKATRDSITGEVKTWSRCDNADQPGAVEEVRRRLLDTEDEADIEPLFFHTTPAGRLKRLRRRQT